MHDVHLEAKGQLSSTHDHSKNKELLKFDSNEEAGEENKPEENLTLEYEATHISQDVFSVYHPIVEEMVVDLRTFSFDPEAK